MFNADDLPPLREVIAAHDLRAQKSLGQNFLLDLNLTRKIVRGAGDLAGKTVIEIGPGPGGLTRAILESDAQRVVAIDYDARIPDVLTPLVTASSGRLNVVHGDALNMDIFSLAEQTKGIVIIANLPYNIATPLLLGWLQKIHQLPTLIHSMTLMFQKEVAQRITADAGEKSYGRLSIMAQWLCRCSRVLDLPPAAFTPPPKISSRVVHFVPNDAGERANVDFEAVETLTAAAFGQRRKMIRSSLSAYKEALCSLGIDEKLRAENLSLQQFLDIAGLGPDFERADKV